MNKRKKSLYIIQNEIEIVAYIYIVIVLKLYAFKRYYFNCIFNRIERNTHRRSNKMKLSPFEKQAN